MSILNINNIPKKHKIITLCGSTKFKKTFEKVNFLATLDNRIILQPGCYAHFDNIHITEEEKIRLDILHKEKILISDCIIVINDNDYIGSSTKSEINYALIKNIPIYYYFI
jgi:hypothetical protein